MRTPSFTNTIHSNPVRLTEPDPVCRLHPQGRKGGFAAGRRPLIPQLVIRALAPFGLRGGERPYGLAQKR